jgi:hypothetical protein
MYDGCMKHLQLRFVDEVLLDRLSVAAKRERRSLNSQILWMLERQLAQGEAMRVIPVGYQGPAQHTYTPDCDGIHEVGPCPPPMHPVEVDWEQPGALTEGLDYEVEK